MDKLPKSHVQFCNMLHDCIDLSDYPENTKLYEVISTEKRKKILQIEDVEDWLRGLPSACTIPFYDFEIREILDSCGNGHWSIDDYWKFSASRILSFAKYPETYAVHEKYL